MNNTNEQKFNTIKEIEKINQERNEKQAQILTKAYFLDALPNLDAENLIVYSTGSICIGWRNAVNKQTVKEVFEAFPITGTNYEMKFASSEKNFVTDSPLVVKWDNSHSYHHPKQFKISYTSGSYKIEIVLPADHFKAHTYYRSFQGKHKGFGRYEMFNDIFIDYFYTQSYSGGYNTLYFLEGAESLAEYENFVKTGIFQYKDEITK